MVLFFIRYGLQVDFSAVFLLIVALLIVCLGNTDEVIAICMCCIPMYTAIDYNYVLLLAILKIIIFNIKQIKIDCLFLFFCLMVLWEMMHSIFVELSIQQIVANFMPIFLLLLIYCLKLRKFDYEFIGIKYAIFTLLTSITLFVRVIIDCNWNFFYAIQRIERLGNISENAEVIGGNINPNSLGIMCVMAITILLQIYIHKMRKKEFIIYIVALVILGLLTQSRTYIVLLLLMYLLFMFNSMNNVKIFLKMIGRMSVGIAVCSVIMMIFFPSLLESFIARWFEDDLSNGRIDIMMESLKTIYSKLSILFFGIGMTDYSKNVLNYVSIAPHDVFSELIMIWGIPGAFLLIWFMVLIIIRTNVTKRTLVNYIPLIIILTKTIAGHLITSAYTMLLLSLAILSIMYNFDEYKVSKLDVNRIHG